MTKNKKYEKNKKKIISKKNYDPKEAFQILNSFEKAKFDETVELHVRLGVDSKQADQQIRGAVILPHGTGKKIKVLVFAKNEEADAAKQAGADYVGGAEFADKIQKENFLDFDVVVASPNMMSIVGRLGKILGPKGLMPSPKAETVSTNVGKAVKDIKAGKVEYRLDKTNIIHCIIGKSSFDNEQLLENFETVMNAIAKAKPQSSKGKYFKSCFITRTMSPSIKVSTSNYGE